MVFIIKFYKFMYYINDIIGMILIVNNVNIWDIFGCFWFWNINIK